MEFVFNCELEFDGVKKVVEKRSEDKEVIRRYVKGWMKEEKKMCRRGIYKEGGVVKWIMYRRRINGVDDVVVWEKYGGDKIVFWINGGLCGWKEFYGMSKG